MTDDATDDEAHRDRAGDDVDPRVGRDGGDDRDGRDDRARLEVTVHGRVQGVGFRYFVRTTAEALGVGGWVANAPDGTVVCVAEGPRSAVRDFARSLADGPAGSRVDRVDVRWTVPIGTDGRFIIRSLGHRGD
jgi:acylphosphatase